MLREENVMRKVKPAQCRRQHHDVGAFFLYQSSESSGCSVPGEEHPSLGPPACSADIHLFENIWPRQFYRNGCCYRKVKLLVMMQLLIFEDLPCLQNAQVCSLYVTVSIESIKYFSN